MLLSELIAQAKVDADKANDAQIADTSWLTFINRGIESLWRLVTSLDQSLYFTASSSFALVGTESGASKDLTSFTPKFRAIHGLDLSPGTSSRATVRRRPFQERNASTGPIGPWVPGPFVPDRGWELRGTNLVITPWERAGGTYQLLYLGAPTAMTISPDSTLDVQLEQWAEYISLFAARRALGIEESQYEECGQRLLELKQEITDTLMRSDEPCRIADVEGDDDWIFG